MNMNNQNTFLTYTGEVFTVEGKYLTYKKNKKDIETKRVPMEVKVHTHINKGRDKKWYDARKKRNAEIYAEQLKELE